MTEPKTYYTEPGIEYEDAIEEIRKIQEISVEIAVRSVYKDKHVILRWVADKKKAIYAFKDENLNVRFDSYGDANIECILHSIETNLEVALTGV